MASQLAVTKPGELTRILNPGVPVSLAYQNASNTKVSTEDLMAQNRFTQNFTSLSLGSDGVSVNIPNQHIIDQCVVHMAFAKLPENVYLPRGWAIRLIEEVSVHIAGATPVRFTYREVFNQLMRDADTDAKRLQVLRLAGEEITDGPADDAPVAHLPLPLPWSCIRYMTEQVGFDTALVNQNIRIVLRLARADEIFSGSGVYPTAMSRAYVQIRQLEFKDPSQEVVRSSMLSNPTALYSYHFNYPQPNQSPIFTGSADPNQPVTLTLQGFQSGNLKNIVFMLQDVAQVAAGTGARNPLYYVPMKQLEVTWNGQVLMRNDEESTGGEWCLSESLAGVCCADYSVAPPTQTVSPFTTLPFKTCWSVQLMVPRDEACSTDLLQAGENMSNQTLTIRFNTPSSGQYRLFTTFNYGANAVIHRQNCQIQWV